MIPNSSDFNGIILIDCLHLGGYSLDSGLISVPFIFKPLELLPQDVDL